MSTVLIEAVAPAAPSLPVWPPAPEPVDVTGRSFVVLQLGPDARAVADGWAAAAAALGPVDRHRWDRLDPDAREALGAVLAGLSCGVRIMVVGPQDDVLLALALAREAGAEPAELRCFVTRTDVLPVYCAHCRETERVVAGPGDVVSCPSCARRLEIHPHVSAVRGSYLGSDATARDLS